VKGEREAHIVVRTPGRESVRRRLAIPIEFAKTASSRRWWAEQEEEHLKTDLMQGPEETKTVMELVDEWIRQREAEGVPSVAEERQRLR
jgi:hypothetical protein